MVLKYFLLYVFFVTVDYYLYNFVDGTYSESYDTARIYPMYNGTLLFIGAEIKVILRATTYAGYISEVDLVKVTEIIRNQTYDVLVPLLLVSIVFLILSNLAVEGLSVIYNKAFEYDQN